MELDVDFVVVDFGEIEPKDAGSPIALMLEPSPDIEGFNRSKLTWTRPKGISTFGCDFARILSDL